LEGINTMNAFNFEFIDRREELAQGKTEKKSIRAGRSLHNAYLPASSPFSFAVGESEKFLRFVAEIPRIDSHNDLFQLLQKEEIQYFIPHQILISAWGDFGAADLQLDVISDIPGLRTGLLKSCDIDSLIKDLYKRWLLHGRRPMLLSSSMDPGLTHSACTCALHRYLKGSWSLLAHASVDARDGSACLYLALNSRSIVNGHRAEYFSFLADSLITQIDIAFRRITALESPSIPVIQNSPASPRVLSAREEEVLLWVSEGKTNVEISNILAVSIFTVKNHLQRIMDKLNASNRTEAAVKYQQLGAKTANLTAARESTPRFMSSFSA
jgi:transcriptional regulator EpsA